MENIMLESDKRDAEAKLFDFGLSQSYYVTKNSTSLSESVGAAYSMSPQVIRKQYTSKADLWACGVVTFVLLSNKWPFDGTTNKQVITKILNNDGNKNFEGVEWKHVSSAKPSPLSVIFWPLTKTVDGMLRSSPSIQMVDPKDLFQGSCSRNGRHDQCVTNALIQNANDGKMKKLAMQVIAYNSSTNDIEKLRQAFSQLRSIIIFIHIRILPFLDAFRVPVTRHNLIVRIVASLTRGAELEIAV